MGFLGVYLSNPNAGAEDFAYTHELSVSPKPVNEQMVVRRLGVRCLPQTTVPPAFRETLSTYPSSLRSYRPSLLWSDAGGPYTAPPAALVNPDTSRPREPKDRLSSSPLAALGIVPGSL